MVRPKRRQCPIRPWIQARSPLISVAVIAGDENLYFDGGWCYGRRGAMPATGAIEHLGPQRRVAWLNRTEDGHRNREN